MEKLSLILPTLQLLLLLASSVIAAPNITTDQSALLALKAQIISDPYRIILENWTISSPVCDWIGVTCGPRNRRVTTLNVSYMDLTGGIPPELGNLSFLVSLDLTRNSFAGYVPQELAGLRRLRFVSLNHNSFAGEVPFLPQVHDLLVRNNSFTSLNSFSNSNETNLETLDLAYNSLQGNIPESMGNLRNLKLLNLGNNELSGVIPSSLANISTLESLTLFRNSFHGTIPEAIGNLGKLNWLNMQFNLLTGSIPYSIFNISTLEVIAFTNNSLSGTLPDGLCLQLPILEQLHLSINDINGRIPSSFGSCPQLRILTLSFNNFSGTIPPEIGNLQMLEELYLRFNQLSGTIPSEFGQLRSLLILSMTRNMLVGSIPPALFNLSSLQVLLIPDNRLSGPLTEEFGNLTMLVQVYLNINNFTGNIPRRFSELPQLDELLLENNFLSGFVPSDIFNMSTLRVLSLTNNTLSGKLPLNLGNYLPSLEELYIGWNNFDGALPNSIMNASRLTLLDLDKNRFNGQIPNSLGELRHLRILNLESNNFTSRQSMFPELEFITSLVNCRFLTMLNFRDNPLNGVLPPSLGNLSSSVENIYASRCRINGAIPGEIGNLNGLVTLYLDENNLDGDLPVALYSLKKLQRLYLSNNQLRGIIPNGLCNLESIGELYLSQNQLIGRIPECLGNVSSLRKIYLDSNNFTSSIPSSIWGLQDLLELDISSNNLTGFLSGQIQNMKVVTYINISMNHLTGDLPEAFQGLQSLINFSLAHNEFQGLIPESMGEMLNLVSLDLSYNNLSGTIPPSLESLNDLVYFNVSFNRLSGEIPLGGPFRNFTSQSFVSNLALCGPLRYGFPQCKVSKDKPKMRAIFIFVPIATFLAIVGISALIYVRRCKKSEPQTAPEMSTTTNGVARVSYYDLLRATNGFSDNNMLGKGSFGSVYKGNFTNGTVVAIKVFNMQQESALKTFQAECEVLRNLRHRNLTSVISSCSNHDFLALVIEYMPNGSLDDWLNSKEDVLSLVQRLDIMIDVASALEYLHHGYSVCVVHCDIKPSNVLLDENMVAHLSDFGITRLLGEGESAIHTSTLATMGYMAPEYGSEGMVSTKCDVYSYGILALQTFTARSPCDAIFSGDLDLKTLVKDSVPHGLSQVIDVNLVQSVEEEHLSKYMACASSVLELALRCLTDSPEERMNMKEVLVELKKIKNQLRT